MKRITLFAFALLFAMASVNAQVIFQEDFQDNGLDDWTTYDKDELPVAPSVDFITNGWNAIDLDGPDGSFGGPAGDIAAMSTSYYDPPGTSNDWLVSPQIELTSGNLIVEWDAKAQDPDFPDGYVLKISTTGNAVEDFTTDLLTVPAEFGASGDEYKHRRVNLSDYAGESVYLAWVNNSTDQFLLVIDNIKVSVGPDCLSPLSVSTENIGSTEADITWEEVDAASNGYTVQVFNAGDDPDTDTPVFDTDVDAGETSVTATGLTALTDYDVYVSAECDDSSSEATMTTFTTAPANDDCSEAIDLTVGTTFDENAVLGSNKNASTSDALPAPECGTFDDTSSDVWFSVTVPDSGNVIIETREAEDSDFDDTTMQVYSGDCDDLTAVDCNEDNDLAGTFFSYVFLTDQTPGDNLKVRVWGFGGSTGDFNISAYEPDCLPVSDVTIGDFTDNGATVSWTENGDATEWEVVYGESGFDLDAGEGTTITVNDDPQTTISDLDKGTEYDVYVRAVCGDDSNSTYSAVETFALPPNNDDLCDATALTVDAGCDDPEAYSNIGATLQDGEPVPECWDSAGETTVWFSFVAPDGPNGNSNVIVSTDFDGVTLTDTEVAVYGEPTDCADLSTLGDPVACDEDSGSINSFNSVLDVNGLTPGETYYVQVTGYSSQTGNFCVEVNNNACPDPTELSVSGVTDSEATVSWTGGGAETDWVVEYGEEGFALGTGTTIDVSGTPQTQLDNLDPETTYEVYVKALCSDEFSSDQVGPVSFTTFAEGECGQVQTGNDFENALYIDEGGQLVANDFIVDPNTTFTADEMTASILTSSPIESLKIVFYDNDGGLPGNEISTFDNVVPTSQDVVGQAFGYDARDVHIDLPESMEFEGTQDIETTYWVQISVALETPDPDNQGAGIEVTTASLIGNPAAFAPDSETEFTAASDGSDGVFSITGSCSELGVKSQNFQNFAYYPNPVEGQLNLKAQTQIQNVEVFNLLGQSVMTENPDQRATQLNFSELQPGVYLMKVKINNAVKTFRVIKK